MTINFNPNTHTYHNEEGLLPSVTAIIAGSEPAGGLLQWACDLVAKRAVTSRSTLATIPPTDQAQLRKAIAWVAMAGNDARDFAGVFGTNVHTICENWIKGTPDTRNYSTDETQAAAHFIDYILEHKLIITDSEYILCSTEGLRYAGTADLRVCYENSHEPAYIADIKTSASMYLNPRASYGKLAQQLAAYAYAPYMVDSTGYAHKAPEVSREYGYVYLVRPQGVKTVRVGLEAGWDQFQRSLATYQWRKQAKEVGELLEANP